MQHQLKDLGLKENLPPPADPDGKYYVTICVRCRTSSAVLQLEESETLNALLREHGDEKVFSEPCMGYEARYAN